MNLLEELSSDVLLSSFFSFTSDKTVKCGESRTFGMRAASTIGRQGPSSEASCYEKRMKLASAAASLSAYQRTA